MNSRKIAVFSLGYLLLIELDYLVNLAACRLAVYWGVFESVRRSVPRKVLEKSLNSRLTEDVVCAVNKRTWCVTCDFVRLCSVHL